MIKSAKNKEMHYLSETFKKGNIQLQKKRKKKKFRISSLPRNDGVFELVLSKVSICDLIKENCMQKERKLWAKLSSRSFFFFFF